MMDAYILAFPAPMAFGKVIDMTCLVQQTSCTRKGACIFYDNDMFRIYHHSFAAIVKFAAFLGYFGACVFASRAAGRNKNEENANSVDMRHSNVQASSGERQHFLSEGDETESNI